MAETLAKNLLDKNEAGYDVYSVGVSAFDGQPASAHAITAMHEFGLDLNGHSSQMISGELINGADYVLAVSGRHLDVVKSACPTANAFTISEFAEGVNFDIIDPFGGDINIYRNTAAELKRLVELCVERILDLKVK